MNETNTTASVNTRSRGRTHGPQRNRPARRNRFRNHNAMRTLRRQAETITHDARGLAASAGAVAREQLDPVKDYVLEKPIQSLLIAAGVGVIFGLVFLRR